NAVNGIKEFCVHFVCCPESEQSINLVDTFRQRSRGRRPDPPVVGCLTRLGERTPKRARRVELPVLRAESAPDPAAVRFQSPCLWRKPQGGACVPGKN